jgi:hypothetical protein
MTNITENELKNKVNRLREYLTVLEDNPGMGPYDAPAPTSRPGQANAATDPRSTTYVARPGQANAATDPRSITYAAGAPTTQSTKPAPDQLAKPAPAAKPAGAPKVAYDKNFPAATAMELQKKLNARDPNLKLAVDGKMGPATRAAMAKYPEITTQTPDEKAAASGQDAPAPVAPAPAPVAPAPAPVAPTGTQVQTDDDGNHMITTPDGKTMVVGPDGKPLPNGGRVTPAPAPAPAAPAPGMQAVGDDDGNTTITRPDGSTMVVGPDGKQIMPGSNPNLPQNKGVFNTVKNAVTGKGDFQKPTGFIPPAPTQESVSFQNDELNRIVSLVRHR